MPLIRISLRKGKSPAHIQAIGNGIHAALVEAVAIPPDDRFQIIEQRDPADLTYDPTYLGIPRTDDVVFITIIASTGRTTEQKKTLYCLIASNLAQDPGLRPEDVLIVLAPNQREDWSFGNGLASYVKD